MKHSKMISRRSFLQAAASAAALSALALTGCGSSSGTSSAAGASSAASASGTTYKVGIVNYVDDASLNQIVASVEARLDEVGAERGVTFNYADYYSNAQADQSNLNQIGADLVADDVDVIVAVATPTASTMLAAVEDTDIPVIYSAVTDPVGAGFDGLDNITGTSDALDTAISPRSACCMTWARIPPPRPLPTPRPSATPTASPTSKRTAPTPPKSRWRWRLWPPAG